MTFKSGLAKMFAPGVCALLFCAHPAAMDAAEYVMGAKSGRPPAENHVFKIVDKDKPLSIVENGAARVEIWLPEGSSPVAGFAAKELASMLGETTGSKIDIVAKRTGNRPAILLGSNVWSKSLAKTDPASFPRDAFTTKVCGDVIVIMGNDDMSIDPEKVMAAWHPDYERGTLFGVYDFMERFAGARFYFPGKAGTVMPKLKTLKIPSVHIFEAPDFQVRKNSLYEGRWLDEPVYAPFGVKQKERMEMMNRLALRWRFQTMEIPCCHSLAHSALKERFAEAHPEYFSLRGDGQRDIIPAPNQPHSGHVCFSSEGLKNEIYLDGEAFLTGKPAEVRNPVPGKGLKFWSRSCFTPGFFNIMPQDGLGPFEMCHCPECAKLVKDKRDTDLIWNFVIDIAERLKKNGVPGQVTAMAYGIAREMPKRDIPSNVLVQVATKGPWSMGSSKELKTENNIIREWADKGGDRKVYLWNYACDFPQGSIPAGVPTVSPRWIAGYYKGLADSISGAYLEDEADYWLFRYLNSYVFFRVCWDTNADVEALLKDHHEKMFGPAAATMGRFFDRLEELWTTKGVKKAKDTPLGPVTVPVPINIVWDENYSDKVMAELDGHLAQSEKLCASDADCLERVRFIKDKFFGETVAAKKKYLGTKREIEDLKLEAPRASEPVAVDGELSEAAWKSAPAVGLVPYKSPYEGGANETKAVLKTSVRTLWTPEKLVVGFECDEPSGADGLTLGEKTGSPDMWKDSCVEVFLTLERKSGDNKFYQILVNAAGENSTAEVTLDSDSVPSYDWKWKSGVESKSKISAGKWTAELSIPLARFLKGAAKPGDTLIVNFARERNLKAADPKTHNLYCWSPFARRGFSELCKFGSVVLVEKATDARPLVTNGSFEKWNEKHGIPEGWGKFDDKKNGVVSRDESAFADGFTSAKLSSQEPNRMELSQKVRLEPDREYRLSFFFKTAGVEAAGAGGACASVTMGKKLLMLPQNSYYTGDSDWTKQAFVFRTPKDLAADAASHVMVRLWNGKGTVWFDDVRLEETGK